MYCYFMLRWSEILHTCSKTFGCPMHGLIQHLPDVCMVRHIYDSLNIYISRNDFPLEDRGYRMILSRSSLIFVLFWLQTVLDRCVTNVGNPHKKDFYVSEHIVENRSPWSIYCSIVTINSIQTLLGYFIFSRLSTTLSICSVRYDLSGRRIRMGAIYNPCLPSM